MPDPLTLQFKVEDLTRRVATLEQEKLAQGIAVLQLAQKYQGRELADIKATLARLESALTQLRDTQIDEKATKVGGERSWKAIWTYVVGGAVATAAVASPIITLVVTR